MVLLLLLLLTYIEVATLESSFLCSFVVLGQLACLRGLGFRDLVSLMWVDDIPSFLYSFLSPPYLVRRCVIGVYEV